jgi:hypothetical protein
LIGKQTQPVEILRDHLPSGARTAYVSIRSYPVQFMVALRLEDLLEGERSRPHLERFATKALLLPEAEHQIRELSQEILPPEEVEKVILELKSAFR